MKDGLIRFFDVDSGDSVDVSFQFNQDYEDVFLTALWSSDSGTMIAKATLDPCHTIIGPETSYIYRIDVSTLAKIVLLSNEGEHPGYSLLDWLEPNMVLLIENGTGLNWHLNPWTGALSLTGE